MVSVCRVATYPGKGGRCFVGCCGGTAVLRSLACYDSGIPSLVAWIHVDFGYQLYFRVGVSTLVYLVCRDHSRQLLGSPYRSAVSERQRGGTGRHASIPLGQSILKDFPES